MKKVKIEDRLENAVNAFFETDADKNAHALAYAGGRAILCNEEQTPFTEKARFWTNIARQAFLFLPGAFLVYYATLSSIIFYPELGFTPLMLFHFAAGGFFCQIGLGSLRKTENLLIPFSIIIFAAVLGFASFALPTETQMAFCFKYSIYFFPAVLIGSKLLQNQIDDK